MVRQNLTLIGALKKLKLVTKNYHVKYPDKDNFLL